MDLEIYESAISFATNIANKAYDDKSKTLTGWDRAYLKKSFDQSMFGVKGSYYVLDETTGEYRIRHFDSKNKDLAMVSMNTAHGLLEASGTFDVRFEQFRMYKVHEATGMNLAEFLELPEYFIIKILETLRMENLEKEKIKAQMQNASESDFNETSQAMRELSEGSRY